MTKKNYLFTGLLLFVLSAGQQITAQDVWSNFKYPAINFVDEDKVSSGAILFNRLVPNPDSLFKDRIMAVCKILYRNPNEVPGKSLFKFNLRLTEGVAATGGQNSDVIDMFLSSQYLAGFYKNNGSNDKTMLDEIKGILTHELTHAYQNNMEGYPYIADVYSCVEGMADGVRIKAGYMPSSRRTGGHWNDGYRVTGYFIEWLSTQDPDFIYKFNQSVLSAKPWSWSKLTQQVFGKPVIEMWAEYQKFLSPNGTKPEAKISADTTSTVTYGTVLFKDKSTGGPFVWRWTFEGGSPATADLKSAYVTYNKAGTYKVSLAVQNAFGKDSIVKTNFIMVKENPDGLLITSLEGTKTAQYNDSPEDENIAKVFDASTSTKYLTFHNSGWIQFDCKKGKKFAIRKYILVSANDSPERDPKDFTLKGSNDGKTWEVIDSQTNVTFPARFKAIGFAPKTTKKYSMFRLEMSNHEGNILQLGDLKLFGL
jgi:PKD repeat protein